MADKTYLIEASKVTPAMEAAATVVVTSKTLQVDSAEVATFEALLPSDETTWMSGETSATTYAEGFQNRGVVLPEHVANG